MQANTVPLSEFFSVLVQLAEEAGKTIHEVLDSKDLQEINKSSQKYDPVTIADLRI